MASCEVIGASSHVDLDKLSCRTFSAGHGRSVRGPRAPQVGAYLTPQANRDVSKGKLVMEMSTSSLPSSSFLGRTSIAGSPVPRCRHIFMATPRSTAKARSGSDQFLASRGAIVASMARTGAVVLDPSRAEPYDKVGDCLIVNIPPAASKFKGIIHFLGGVFASAAPDLTYKLLMQGLAKDGYLVITTPYNATFDHAHCAKELNKKFTACINQLIGSRVRLPGGTYSSDVVSGLPIYGVGHSNGGLMQVMMSSLNDDGVRNKANVIISFNNKRASEAVPNINQVGPIVMGVSAAIESSPFADFARRVRDEASKAAVQAATMAPLPPGISRKDLEPIFQLAEQFLPLVNEIGGGVSEFTPSPEENRRIVSASYNVQKSLLVKFAVDGIDETRRLETTLRARMPAINGTVEVCQLPGTHITPLAQDIPWRVDGPATPLSAVAEALRDGALDDLRRLIDTINGWLERV